MARTVRQIIEDSKGRPPRMELPGNPRYQPESLKPFFGYDNLAKFQIEVEWALLKVLAKLGILPSEAVTPLTDGLKQVLCQDITTSLQDEIEREITHHDIRALIKAMQELIRLSLALLLSKWLHIPATSYDVIETARILAYKQAFRQVSFPTLLNLISILREKIIAFSDALQIGRTHGKHAEPITVGFWLATILSRILDISQHLEERERELKGKFSGPVGAGNSQVAFGFEERAQKKFGKSFEELVLSELKLLPAPISTQILPPEPLARFLFEYNLLSAALAQLSLDCRNLQRTEIAEIGEPFGETQDSSSAMPHKRNPITFENTQGISLIVKHEFGKVLDTLLSEHQRDLIGSPVMREFPGIVVLVQYQLETLKRVLPHLSVDREALKRNLDLQKHLILSEAIYIALVMAGYPDDAYQLVNRTLVPRAQASGQFLIDELISLAEESPENFTPVVKNIPEQLIQLFRSPEDFTGKAKEKALAIADKATVFLTNHKASY